jgi:enoyl-[acyl-carrier-protein] reductase (NADH)
VFSISAGPAQTLAAAAIRLIKAVQAAPAQCVQAVPDKQARPSENISKLQTKLERKKL